MGGFSVDSSLHEKNTSLAEDAGLLHDARNLLSALGLYCDLLNRPGVLAPEHRHYAAELQGIAERSSALLERMLPCGDRREPARWTDPLETSPHMEDATAHLRALAPLLRGVSGPAVEVLVSGPLCAVPLPFPAEAMERIAVNLVRNAADAVEQTRTQGGLIRVALTERAGLVRLEVEDNGPGMPPAVAAAFLRPTPLPAGARRGLGHRIVHELSAATKGRLSIKVQPGRGTAIRVEWILPSGNSMAAAPASASRSVKGAVPAC